MEKQSKGTATIKATPHNLELLIEVLTPVNEQLTNLQNLQNMYPKLLSVKTEHLLYWLNIINQVQNHKNVKVPIRFFTNLISALQSYNSAINLNMPAIATEIYNTCFIASKELISFVQS